jgi:hypothetical protein
MGQYPKEKAIQIFFLIYLFVTSKGSQIPNEIEKLLDL